MGGFLALLLATIIRWLPRDLFDGALHPWVYTGWLVDYSSGFTRRGLSGELLHLASGHIHPYVAVTILSWLLLVSVAVAYLRLCLKSIDRIGPLCLVALLFLPSLLPFYMYDHAALGRKEMIGYLILLIHLLALERHGVGSATEGGKTGLAPRRVVRIAIPIVVLLSLHGLVHEASFLLFLPAHALITWSALSRSRDLHWRGKVVYLSLLYLPVVVSFALVVSSSRPTFEAARDICEQWESLRALESGSCNVGGDRGMWALPGAFTALPWTLSQAASLPQRIRPSAVLAWLLTFSILGSLTVSFGGITAASIIAGDPSSTAASRTYHSVKVGLKYFLLPMAVSLPLYVVGWDFGRWFAVVCINYSIVALSREVNRLEYDLTQRKRWRLVTYGAKCMTRLGSGVEARRRTWNAAMLVALLFVILFIRLPHCCNGWAILAEPLRSWVREMLGGLGGLPGP